jgi:hypothetical protein
MMSNNVRHDGARRGSDYVDILGDAIRENPVSAALIGMGVIWLFMGGHKTSLLGGGGRTSIFQAVGENAQQAGSAVGRAAGLVGAAISSGVDAVTDTAAEAGRMVRDVASVSAGSAAEKMSSAYDVAGDLAVEATNKFSSGAREATQVAKSSGAKLGGALQQNLTDLLERQPLFLGAIGLAIGAGIASSFPATEVEQQVMGSVSAGLQEKISEAGGLVKDMATAALEEASHQGRTSPPH